MGMYEYANVLLTERHSFGDQTINDQPQLEAMADQTGVNSKTIAFSIANPSAVVNSIVRALECKNKIEKCGRVSVLAGLNSYPDQSL